MSKINQVINHPEWRLIREPLSTKELKAIYQHLYDTVGSSYTLEQFAREVEKAHGIGLDYKDSAKLKSIMG
jgi:hypothetical protein